MSGITRFSSGLPVTLVETDDASLLGTSGAGAISLPIDTPNFTPGSLKIGDPHSTTVPYFNTSLFSVEATGTLGNARRRFFSGPRSNNWDVALLKDTLIKEGVNLEFRAELFNAFNHAQFGRPDGNISDTQQVDPDTGHLTGFGHGQLREPSSDYAAFVEAPLLGSLAHHRQVNLGGPLRGGPSEKVISTSSLP